MVGTEAEAMEECCLLSGSPRLALLFYYTPKDRLLWSGALHSGLGPSVLTVNQKKMLYRLTYRPLWRKHFLN